jgi:hypothetical protein
MSQTVLFELEMPGDLGRFQLPSAVQSRLQFLLNKQDDEGSLTQAEREEADGLVDLVELLALLKLRSERSSDSELER